MLIEYQMMISQANFQSKLIKFNDLYDISEKLNESEMKSESVFSDIKPLDKQDIDRILTQESSDNLLEEWEDDQSIKIEY